MFYCYFIKVNRRSLTTPFPCLSSSVSILMAAFHNVISAGERPFCLLAAASVQGGHVFSSLSTSGCSNTFVVVIYSIKLTGTSLPVLCPLLCSVFAIFCAIALGGPVALARCITAVKLVKRGSNAAGRWGTLCCVSFALRLNELLLRYLQFSVEHPKSSCFTCLTLVPFLRGW